MIISEAPDIKKSIIDILSHISLPHIRADRIYTFRSKGSTSRARARIWSFPKIWQRALNISPCYVIEVLSEKYDKLSPDEQKKVLIHELLHIPKNFSGALRPHKAHKWRLNHHMVENYFKKYKTNKSISIHTEQTHHLYDKV